MIALQPTLPRKILRIAAGLLVIGLLVWTGEAAAGDGVVRIQSPPETIQPAGFVNFGQPAMQYELQRPAPYVLPGNAHPYAMPQRHHPVDRWYYVRRFFGMDKQKQTGPRFQYNYGHGISSSRLTPTSRVFR